MLLLWNVNSSFEYFRVFPLAQVSCLQSAMTSKFKKIGTFKLRFFKTLNIIKSSTLFKFVIFLNFEISYWYIFHNYTELYEKQRYLSWIWFTERHKVSDRFFAHSEPINWHDLTLITKSQNKILWKKSMQKEKKFRCV